MKEILPETGQMMQEILQLKNDLKIDFLIVSYLEVIIRSGYGLRERNQEKRYSK